MTETPLLKPKTSWFVVLGIAIMATIASSGITLAIAYSVLLGKNTASRLGNVPAIKKNAVDAVAASGRLEPQGEIHNLSAPNASEGVRVERLQVNVGDKVKAGQVIAILDNHGRLQAAWQRSQTRVKVAQARLGQIEAGAKIGEIKAQKATISVLEAELQGQTTAQSANIERLQAELYNAKTECQRHQKLYRDGAISASIQDKICLNQKTFQDRLEEAQATRNRTTDTYRKKLAEAKAVLEKIVEVRPVDIAVARAELEEAKADAQQAQANLNIAYLRAPKEGQILKINTRPGEAISDKGIVALGKTDNMYAIAEVYETDISKIRIGQKATVTSFGFLGQLSGVVDEVGLQIGKKDVLNTDPTADVDSRVVEVKVRLDRDSSKQVSGLTNLQVNVVVHLDKG
jgi:HlyD family secretion protein